MSITGPLLVGQDFEQLSGATCRKGDFSLLIGLGHQKAASNSKSVALEIEGPRNPFILFLESDFAPLSGDSTIIGFYQCWSRDNQDETSDNLFEQFALNPNGNPNGGRFSSINLKLLPPAFFVVMTNATLRFELSQVFGEGSFYDEFNLGYYSPLGRQQINQKLAQSSQSGLKILIASIFGQEAWIPLASRPLNEEKFLDSLKRLSDFLSRPELAGRVRLEEYPFKSLLLVTSEHSSHTFENARAYLDIMKSQGSDWGIAEEVFAVLATPTEEPIETQHLSSSLSKPYVLSFDLQGS